MGWYGRVALLTFLVTLGMLTNAIVVLRHPACIATLGVVLFMTLFVVGPVYLLTRRA